MNYTEQVKCNNCKSNVLRGQTVILETPKGRFRICRSCYAEYEQRKANENYQATKDNVNRFGLDIDPYDIAKKKEKFVKDIKEGKWQNIL